jgi:CRISPR-associated protein Cmr4
MATYQRQRYLLMTVDPVHIGTGGYRLGRVDNSIVREPGTRVPKIPGTSLHGAARSYAAQLYETPEAAGQSQEKVQNPDQNPVCYTFGYIKKTNNGKDVKAYSGVVNIFDAHVLLFPVYSMTGPVWVTTLGRLREADFTVKHNGADLATEPQTGTALLTWERQDALNLGWLMVEVKAQISVEAPKEWQKEQRWQAVKDHIVLVSESLFSHVVNSNLEVRTSVAIDPERGAAEDKALFTYEALPRATFLTTEVVLDDYREAFPKDKCGEGKTDKNNPLPGTPWHGPLDVVTAGLRMIEWLGVGGMGTRGFGRLVIVGEPLEQKYGEERSNEQ